MHLALMWAIGVGVLLTLPDSALPSSPGWLPPLASAWLDSLVHAALFFVQGWLLVRLRGGDGRRRYRRFTVGLLCLGYATVLELVQTTVPGRSFELLDILFAGIGFGAAFFVDVLRPAVHAG